MRVAGSPSPTPTATSIVTTTPIATVTRTPAATATPCPITFTDVFPTDYFYEAVRYLYCAGVISGYSDGTFRPGNPATRGQIAKTVYNALK